MTLQLVAGPQHEERRSRRKRETGGDARAPVTMADAERGALEERRNMDGEGPRLSIGAPRDSGPAWPRARERAARRGLDQVAPGRGGHPGIASVHEVPLVVRGVSRCPRSSGPQP